MLPGSDSRDDEDRWPHSTLSSSRYSESERVLIIITPVKDLTQGCPQQAGRIRGATHLLRLRDIL